jgi:AraC family transcriptional regulator
MLSLEKTRTGSAPRTHAERPIKVPLNGEDKPMSKPILRVLSQEHQPDTAQQRDLLNGETPHADAEMTRVLKTAPLRMASDPTSGVITFWRHDPLHDVVKPMADHVIMAFPDEPVRFERRDGKAYVSGTTRPGTLTVIPAGSSSRWDIHQPLSVLQLYLPQTTLERVAHEAGTSAVSELVERTAHPDPITSRLLLSAADAWKAARRWMRCSGIN